MVKKVKGLGGSAPRAADALLDTSRDKGKLIAETLRFLNRAKTLIEKAKENDGQVDTREIQAIVAALLPDLNALAGGDVGGRVSKVQEGYRTLLGLLKEVPIVRDFLEDKYPEFFTFFDNLAIEAAKAEAEAELPELIPELLLDTPEQSSEALRSIEKQCGRIVDEAVLFKGNMPDIQSRAEVINSGPFKERAAFVTAINEAVRIVGEQVEELETLRSRSEALLAEARTADASRRNEILREIESMPLADISAIAGASLTRVRTGVAQERQHVRAEIESLSAQLPSEKQEDGEKIVGRMVSSGKNLKDAKLMGLLAEMEALAQVPELSGGDRVTVKSDVDILGSGEKGEKKERLRLPEEERTKLQSLVSDAAKYTELSDDPRNQQGATKLYSQGDLDAFNAERDALRYKYSESDILEIARIIVVAQEKKIYEPGELIWNASRAFQSFFGMGALSPEEYIDEYRKLKGRETQPVLEFAANPEPSPASGVATPPRVYRRGKSAPPLVVEPAAPEPAPVPEAAAPEIDAQEFIELRNRIDALFGQLSQRDVWRSDVQVSGDEESLFALESDVARRNYLRTILFYSVSSQDSLLLRITQQGHNAQRVGEIFDKILRASRGLSQDQRIALYSVTPVSVEEIDGDEDKGDDRPRIVPVRRALRTKGLVGARRSVPYLVDANRPRTLVEAEWEEEGPEAPRPDVEPTPSLDAPLPPPQPEAPRIPPLSVPSPGPVREPGPLLVATGAVNGREVSSEAEKETVFARMRGWVREKRDELKDSDVYRVHMKGEKTEAELDGSASTLSVPAMITGAVLSGALSYSGYALPVDGIRYMSQKRYVAGERDEISRAFHAAFKEHQDRERHRGDVQEGRRLYARKDELWERIFSSRYLTDPQKKELFDKLNQTIFDFQNNANPHDEHLNREVGRILENAIRTRISEEKVLKEATNTLFMVTGAQFLRAPAYGAISLYERWNRLTREAPESKAGDRLRSVVSGGFNEWFDEFKGKRGRLAQAAAIGTAARFVGMGATVVESGVASDAIGAFFRAWENREAFYPPELSGLWQRYEGIDEIRDQLVVAQEVSVADVSEPPPAAYTRVEIPTPPQGDVFDVVSDAPEPVPEPSRSEESIPDVEPVVDAEVVMSPRNIPSESIVGTNVTNNGITQALLSGVEARQDLLRSAEQATLRDDSTAALFVRRMAAKDGLLNYWFGEGAVGNVSVVPTYDTEGVPHIAFLNPKTGETYSVDDLKKLGWLVKAPK